MLSVQSCKNLLDGFVEHYQHVQQQDQRDAKQLRPVLVDLFAGFSNAVKNWRKNQKETADDFNLLEVMQLTGDEIRHSMVLAWLLDWDIAGLGTHAQGDLGLRLFLRELGLADEPCFGAPLPPYSVKREVADKESRLDIQVAARGRFLIGIEVKIWANEGIDQTLREWDDLVERAKELDLPDAPERTVRAYFLTPDGVKPLSDNFIPVKWRQLAKVFRQFADAAKPSDVKLFARHYARGLERFVIPESDEREHSDGRETV